jgi:hypothetical protein
VICAYLRSLYTPPPDAAEPRPLGVRRPLLKSTDRPRSPVSAPGGGAREAQLEEREVRLTAQRILYQNLQPGPDPDHPRSAFWRDIDLDLTGAILIDFSLARCTIANASFRKTTFTGVAGFCEVKIGGDAAFDGAKFGGTAYFDEAEFGSPADFGEAKFSGDVLFDEARFGGHVWFGGARFGGDVSFNEATFDGDVGFVSSSFFDGREFDPIEHGVPRRLVHLEPF